MFVDEIIGQDQPNDWFHMATGMKCDRRAGLIE